MVNVFGQFIPYYQVKMSSRIYNKISLVLYLIIIS